MKRKWKHTCMLASSIQFFGTRAPVLLAQISIVAKCTLNFPVGYTDAKGGLKISLLNHVSHWTKLEFPLLYHRHAAKFTYSAPQSLPFSGPTSVLFCVGGKQSSWSWLPGLILKNLCRLVSQGNWKSSLYIWNEWNSGAEQRTHLW